MKVLVLGDIHNRVNKAKKLLQIPHDAAVILGDYLDPYNEVNLATNKETVDFILDLLKSNKNTLLLGNHDLHYIFPRDYLINSSRYNAAAQRLWHKLLIPHINKFKLVHRINNIVFTHAGYNQATWDKFPPSKVPRVWREQLKCPFIKYDLFKVGTLRGGFGVAGITWADFPHEVDQIPGILQIVGHTRCKVPWYRKRTNDINIEFEDSMFLGTNQIPNEGLLNIDTQQNYAILINTTDNTITTFKNDFDE